MSLRYNRSGKRIKSFTRTPKKPKVLLIEDDRTMRRIVRAKIGDHCDFLAAGNASLSASLFKTQSPDLVFVDINLPDTSGHDLLQWMFKVNPDTFAVMFSGNDDNNNVLKAVETGARGFISKPFDLSKMMFFIDQCRA